MSDNDEFDIDPPPPNPERQSSYIILRKKSVSSRRNSGDLDPDLNYLPFDNKRSTMSYNITPHHYDDDDDDTNNNNHNNNNNDDNDYENKQDNNENSEDNGDGGGVQIMEHDDDNNNMNDEILTDDDHDNNNNSYNDSYNNNNDDNDDDKVGDMEEAMKDSQIGNIYVGNNSSHARVESGLLTTIDENFNHNNNNDNNDIDIESNNSNNLHSNHIANDTVVSPLSPDLNNLGSVLEQLRLAKEALEDERDKSRTLENRIRLLKTNTNKELQQIRQKSKISLDLTNNIIEKQIADESGKHETKYQQEMNKLKQEFEYKMKQLEIQYKQKLNQSEKLRRQSVHEMDLQIKELTQQHRIEKNQMESQIKTLQQNIETETSKDRLIREWHNKYDVLMSEFKTMKQNYENVIEQMQKEQQSELEEETNKYTQSIAKLKSENRQFKRERDQLKADNKNLNVLIGQYKEKLKKFVHENGVFRATINSKEDEIKRLRKKISKLKSDENEDTSNNGDKQDSVEPNDSKDGSPNPPNAKQRRKQLSRRNSSITILDDGNQKTIEIINLANEVDDEDLADLLADDNDPKRGGNNNNHSSHGRSGSQFGSKLTAPNNAGGLSTIEDNSVSEEDNIMLKINNEEKQIDDDSPVKEIYESKIESLNVKIRSLTSDVSRLQREKEMLSSNMEAQKSKLESTITSLKDEMSEKVHTLKTRFEYQIEKLNSDIERYKIKLININDTFEKDLLMKDSRIEELNQLLTDKTDENNNMSEMMQYLEDRIALLQDYEADIEAYEDEINAIDKENQRLLEEKAAKESEISKVVETLQGKEHEIAELAQTFHKTKDTVVELTQIVNTLKEENLALKKTGVGGGNLNTPRATTTSNGDGGFLNNLDDDDDIDGNGMDNDVPISNDILNEDINIIDEDSERTPQPIESENRLMENERNIEMKSENDIEMLLQKRLSIAIEENEKHLNSNMQEMMKKEKEKWENESKLKYHDILEKERRNIRDELEGIFKPAMNELTDKLKQLQYEMDNIRTKHEKEINDITESKLQLVRALAAAMDSMRDELRPKK